MATFRDSAASNLVHDSPCQFVPSTPSLHRPLCRSPAAEVPVLLSTINQDNLTRQLFTPLVNANMASPVSTGTSIHTEMEYGERVILQDIPVTLLPASGNQTANIEQIVPTTPVSNTRRTQGTPLLASLTLQMSPSPRNYTHDVRLDPNYDVRPEPGHSRARKQRQRSRSLLSLQCLSGVCVSEQQTEEELFSLLNGSEEDIFI